MPDHVVGFVTKNLKRSQNSGMVVIGIHHIGHFRSCQMILLSHRAPMKQRETRTSQNEEPTDEKLLADLKSAKTPTREDCLCNFRSCA